MNCSNCNVVNFNSGEANEREKIMCENGHFLCIKCYASSKTKCSQCGGRLFDCNENIPMSQHYANWTLDMICDWTKMNEESTRYSNDSLDVDCDGSRDSPSMDLLFSRSGCFDRESVDNSNNLNMLNSKWRSQICEDLNLNTNQINNQNRYIDGQHSTYFENLEDPIEHNSNLVKKDTRQNLVDQMKDEIRGKIKEELHNLFKNDPRTSIKPEEHMCVKQCNTIGVSTESEPSFEPKSQSYKGSKEHIVEVIDLNQNKYIKASQDYSVMSVGIEHNINSKTFENVSGKKSSSEVNQQLQHSETDPTTTMIEDTNFYKLLREKFSKMPPNKLELIISSICNTEESKISNEDGGNQFQDNLQEEQTKNDFPLILNSSRASYSPPSCHQITTLPNPQFQLISNAAKPPAQTVDATTLHIPRSPVLCPISSCRQACFVSDFTRHIAVDHTNAPMERILPRQCKNFFLDPKLIHFGSNRCQMLLLVKDKISNLGHEKFKDLIPVMVMSTKVSTFELCSNKSESQNSVANNLTGGFLMIWLTGLMPPQVPIFFCLTVWARTGNMPSCHIVHSGQLYSIRNSQNAIQIQASGQRLLLSQNQVDLLTNNGRNMLELQIVVN